MTLLIGYLSMAILNKDKTAPDLEVEIVYQPALPGKTFKVDIKNRGGQTAKEAHIFFQLYQNEQVVESAQLKINYVLMHVKVSGWISFS